MTKSLRYNSNKPEFTSLSPCALIELMKHATYGRMKYPDNENQPNWSLGQKQSTLVNAIMRHLLAYMSGETFDTDLKSSYHMAAIMWNAMVLLHQDINFEQYREFFDLWYDGKLDISLNQEFVEQLKENNYGTPNEQ